MFGVGLVHMLIGYTGSGMLLSMDWRVPRMDRLVQEIEPVVNKSFLIQYPHPVQTR